MELGLSRDNGTKLPTKKSKSWVPLTPDAPELLEVTHHSAKLHWEDSLERTIRKQRRGLEKEVLTVLQATDERDANFITVYSGYGKEYVAKDLRPESWYLFRIHFQNQAGASEWSPSQRAKTKGKPPTSDDLHKAIHLGKLDLFDKTLESGTIQVDALDKFEETCLMDASKRGANDFVTRLLEYGADVNLQSPSGKTALMLACFHGHRETVKILRQNGASFDLHDNGGLYCIHYGVDGKRVQLLELILDDGCNVNQRDTYQSWTPMHRASLLGEVEVSRLLLRYGADVDAQDVDGKTPLMMAVINGHTEQVQLLMEKGADIHLKAASGASAYEMGKQSERNPIKTIFIHLPKD